MKFQELNEWDLDKAKNIYTESFNKKEKNLSLPILGHILGLYLEEELIGIAQIDFINNIFENKKIAYINSLCIKKEYQNKGYGTILLNNCINFAKQKNANMINMTPNKTRIYAHKLYKKFNFDKIDTQFFKKDL